MTTHARMAARGTMHCMVPPRRRADFYLGGFVAYHDIIQIHHVARMP